MRTLLLLLCALAFSASAQELRDPWVPPHVKKSPTYVPTQGDELRAQVEQKLKATFDAADKSGTGSLTREQARAAGLGFIAENFDAIDRRKSGAVRFDDVKLFLKNRDAP
jgi:hypothetical protein